MKTNKIIAFGEKTTLVLEFEEEYDCTEQTWLRFCHEHYPEESIQKVYDAKKHHVCQYCGNVAKGTDKNVLCEECREMFGHAFFSEL